MIIDLTKYIKTPFTLVVMKIATLFLSARAGGGRRGKIEPVAGRKMMVYYTH